MNPWNTENLTAYCESNRIQVGGHIEERIRAEAAARMMEFNSDKRTLDALETLCAKSVVDLTETDLVKVFRTFGHLAEDRRFPALMRKNGCESTRLLKAYEKFLAQ